MMRWMLRCMLAPAVILSFTVPANAENPLFEELRTRGVVADGGARFPLPAPSLRDGMTPAEQQAEAERRGIELALARARAERGAAANPQHRRMLDEAIDALEQKLGAHARPKQA